MKDGLKSFSFLLIAILLIKLSAFHLYEDHDPLEDRDHCELCLIAIDGLQLEGLDPPPVLIPKTPVATFFQPVLRSVQRAHDQISCVSRLFSRPPPARQGVAPLLTFRILFWHPQKGKSCSGFD